MNRCRSTSGQAHITRRCGRHQRSERGSAVVELVVLTPVLIAFALFVVFAGRLARTATAVRHAADQAARSATLVADARMEPVASGVAHDELREIGCVEPSVVVSDAVEAGLRTVTVTVRCVVDRGQLAPLVPGRHVMEATSTEVVDRFRAGGRP